MPSHVEEAEELLDRDEDDGVKLEPFNLAQERAEGFFDESGHYVENKKDDAEETDAWLGSEDGEHQPNRSLTLSFWNISRSCVIGTPFACRKRC